MTPEVRIIRITEQIAHLKVLLNVEEEKLQASHRNLTAWTKEILVNEAVIASFKFRIHDFEDELDQLHAAIKPRRMPKHKRDKT